MRALAASMALLVLVAAAGWSAPRRASAAPTTLVLGPTGDSYVYADASAAGSNFGAAPALFISYDEFNQEQYALLSFDLGGVPAGATIESARLELFVNGAAQAVEVRVERSAEPWSAGSVTWNNRPASAPIGVSRGVGAGGGAYVGWEIGALVSEWRALRRPSPNFGLALRGPAAYNLGLSLGSAESANPPRLVVSYTPIIAIDLRVALEWEPGSGDALGPELSPGCPLPTAGVPAGYRANLERGLEEAARYLYSYSEGQLTLGAVSIGVDNKSWREADVRLLASSSYRPSAYVGGIVDEPRRAEVAAGRPVWYYPAPVFLGRLWDGGTARCGGWGEAEGWRTIGHELAHFALFLYDQYFNLRDGAPQYCASGDLAFLSYGRDRAPALRGGMASTLMAYHYTADRLWRGEPAPATGARRLGCVDTPHDFVYAGRSEWQALQAFYPSLRIPEGGSVGRDWEASFDAEVRGRGIFSLSWPETVRSDSSAAVRLAPLAVGGLVGEAYLVREGPAGRPQRIVGQGRRVPGELAPPPFLGATAGAAERAAIFVDDPVAGRRYAVPPVLPAGGLALDPGATTTVVAAPSEWRPTMVLTPTLVGDGSGRSEVAALNLRLDDCNAKSAQIDVVHCPAGEDCGQPARVSRSTDGSFRHSFGPFPLDGRSEPPALYGYIYARSVDTGEEYISWYQIGGGVGPAHIDGHAPMVDGMAGVEPPAGAAVGGRDNRVLIAPAPSCSAGALPAGIAGLIGPPLGLQVTLASNPQLQLPQREWGAAGQGDPPLRVRLAYDEGLLDALGVDEARLVLLRLAPGGAAWQLVAEEGRSPELDWIAAAPQPFGGDGEVYALGYRQARVFLPALLR